MALKDFSFAQLDKKARLSVGTVEKKSGKVHMGRGMCSTARSCTHR